MESKTMKTRITAVAVTLVMLLTLVPMLVLAEGYDVQGTDILVYFTTPAATDISASETDDAYYDVATKPLGTTGSIEFDMGGSQGWGAANNLSDWKAWVKLYSDAARTNQVASGEDGSLVVTSNGNAKNLAKVQDKGINFKVAYSNLTAEQTYYLVLPKEIYFVSNNGSTTHYLNKDIVLEFKASDATEPDPEPDPDPDPEPEVTPLTLSAESLTVEKNVRSSWVDIRCDSSDMPLTVAAADASIARVQYVGNDTVNHFRVTGTNYGTTDVIVTSADGQKTATCKVTVPFPPVSGIGLSNTVLQLEPNDSQTLSATVFPVEAENKKVTWSSSDETVARVDENGTVTAVSNGTATITATTEDGGKTASCIVNPKEESISYGIQGNADALALYVRQLDGNAVPADIQTMRLTNGDYWNILPTAHSYYRKNFMLSVDIGNAEGLGSYNTDELYGKVVLYDDKDLTHVVSTFEKGNKDFKISKYGEQWTWERSADGAMLVVQINSLEEDKDYYLVFQKDIEGAGVTLGSNVIFEFHSRPADPMTAELVSSEGNDLKSRTQTTLKVENMQNGNPEDYTYKFIVYNTSTNQWYKLQDFGPETEFDWYTGPAGVKNLYVDIKSKTDETDVTRIALEGVNVTDSDLAVKSFTIAPEGVLPTQSQAKLTAEAEKGTEPYEYKFIVHNNRTDEWYRIQDFSENNSCEWYTAGADSKTLYVDVKDATGKVVRASLDVTVK